MLYTSPHPELPHTSKKKKHPRRHRKLLDVIDISVTWLWWCYHRVCICPNLIRLFPLRIHSSLYISYISIELKNHYGSLERSSTLQYLHISVTVLNKRILILSVCQHSGLLQGLGREDVNTCIYFCPYKINNHIVRPICTTTYYLNEYIISLRLRKILCFQTKAWFGCLLWVNAKLMAWLRQSRLPSLPLFNFCTSPLTHNIFSESMTFHFVPGMGDRKLN